jgi:hypothetical protein
VTATSVRARSKRKLPVCVIARMAQRLPFANFSLFLKLAWFPALATFVAQIGVSVWATASKQPLLNLLWLLLYWVAATMFGVAWTRFTLLGREALPTKFPLRYGHREAYTMAADILILLGIFTLPAVLALMTYLAWSKFYAYYLLGTFVVCLVAALAIGIRFVFVHPAIAVDSFRGVAETWHQSRGYVLRIMGLSLLAQLPLLIVRSGLKSAEKHIDLDIASSVLLGSGEILLDLAIVAVTCSAMALAFRWVVRWRPLQF